MLPDPSRPLPRRSRHRPGRSTTRLDAAEQRLRRLDAEAARVARRLESLQHAVDALPHAAEPGGGAHAPAPEAPGPSLLPPPPDPDTAQRRRAAEEYALLVERVTTLVEAVVPEGATVAVISKGDPALVQLEGRHGCHFPQADDGRYAGYHPATSQDAVAHLQALRSRGVRFLVVPDTSRWWLEHYEGLRHHLEASGRVLADDAAALVVDLAPAEAVGRRWQEPDRLADLRALRAQQLGDLLCALLPPGASVAVLVAPGEPAPQLGGPVPVLRLPSACTLADLEEVTAGGHEFLVVPAGGSEVRLGEQLADHRRCRQLVRRDGIGSLYQVTTLEGSTR